MIYKFCPKCGGKLGKIKEENHQRLACQNCHFVFYQNSKPTASAVILNQQGRVLLAKRGIEPQKNYWDLPGGFLELNEHPESGLKRELLEELDVKVKIMKFLGVVMDKYGLNKDFSYTLNLFYLAKMIDGKPKAMSDITEIRWFDRNNLPLEKIAFKCISQALKKWVKKEK